jgi:hypothetical protein
MSTVPVAGADGVVRQMPIAAWRDVELPAAIRRAWTEPDELARIVERAIEIGLHADVSEAARHLGRVDPRRDRRYGLPAIVLARSGQHRRAEELLERHERLYGHSAFSLCAAAEVALSGNRRAKGLALLRQSLELEPAASRPLRLLVGESSREGSAAAVDAVRAIAALRGAWRAKLWLAADATSTEDDAATLIREAIAESPGDPDVLAVASAVLARRGLARDLVDLVGGRYDADHDAVECGVNVLFGHLLLGLRSEGESLLAKLAPRLDAAGFVDYSVFYRAAFRRRDGEGRAEEPRVSNAPLVRAIAAGARQGSKKARRRSWQLLVDSSLLVPVARVWIDVPLFESAWPVWRAPLEIVTGVDSEGREVAIAFSDERALAAWGTTDAPSVPMETRALLRLLVEEHGCSLVVNPAGPTALELVAPDIEALLEGKEPEGEESGIRFLAERVRGGVPRGFVDAVRAHLGESGVAREAWLFEIVDDRNGVTPAIAIGFTPEADDRERRDLLVDAPDAVRWDVRSSRRVRFLAIEEGRLADYLRAEGTPIPLL